MSSASDRRMWSSCSWNHRIGPGWVSIWVGAELKDNFGEFSVSVLVSADSRIHQLRFTSGQFVCSLKSRIMVPKIAVSCSVPNAVRVDSVLWQLSSPSRSKMVPSLLIRSCMSSWRVLRDSSGLWLFDVTAALVLEVRGFTCSAAESSRAEKSPYLLAYGLVVSDLRSWANTRLCLIVLNCSVHVLVVFRTSSGPARSLLFGLFDVEEAQWYLCSNSNVLFCGCVTKQGSDIAAEQSRRHTCSLGEWSSDCSTDRRLETHEFDTESTMSRHAVYNI